MNKEKELHFFRTLQTNIATVVKVERSNRKFITENRSDNKTLL